jgi:hypothetical protein
MSFTRFKMMNVPVSSRHFDGLRRGGFSALSDLMMTLPFPLDGNGILDCSIVAAICASTSGCAN